MKSPDVAFISGHLDLSLEQFHMHYVPKLKMAIEKGHQFVMGNAMGADTMALEYLLQNCPSKDRITVYVYAKRPEVQQGISFRLSKMVGVHVVSGFKTYLDRDATCTKASTNDIAWVRPKEETAKLLGKKYDPNRLSGTEQNLLRRKLKN